MLLTDPRGELPSRAQRRALGQELRARASRGSHAAWDPPPDRIDPVTAVLASGRGRPAHLLAIRHARMAVSPFAFLRGSPALMASDLAGTPSTGLAPWLCGDAHLANFGLYASPERNLVFDFNDFGEVHPGAWEWDLKRLAASTAVAARCSGSGDDAARTAAAHAARGYREAMLRLAEAPWLEIHHVHEEAHAIPSRIFSKGGRRSLEHARQKAEMRTGDPSLKRFAVQGEDKAWAFREQPPLLTLLPEEEAMEIVAALGPYAARLQPDVRDLFERYRVRHAAAKVVGIGGVGLRAYVVLLTGAGPEDALFLQVKEVGFSAIGGHGARRPATPHQGERVVEGQRRLQSVGDEFLGWTTIGPRHYYVRRLSDVKGAAAFDSLRASDLGAYASLCGAMLAKAHARSGAPASIAGYLGGSERMDVVIADFAMAYADQAEHDHEAFTAAIGRGEVEAQGGG